MPRKPTPTPEDSNLDIDVDALQTASAARDEAEARFMETAERLGVDAPYNLERSIQICLAMRDVASRAFFELGRQLLLIKEHEHHGEFKDIVENRLNLPYHTVRRYMQAVVKFMDGTSRRKLVNQLSQTKILELMVEEDDELDALAEGGTIAGLELDEIQRMSGRELRAALKAERDEREKESAANDQIIAEKNKKLDTLTKQLNGRKAEGWPVEVGEYCDSLVNLSVDACSAITYFSEEAIRLGNLDMGDSDEAEEARQVASKLVMAQLQSITGTLIHALENAAVVHAIGNMPMSPRTEVGQKLVERFQYVILHGHDDPDATAAAE